MNFQISEDEISNLENVRNQLGLIARLLDHVCTGEELGITESELHAFVDSQKRAVARVLESVHERTEKALIQEAALHVSIAPELLIALMDAANGTLTDSDELLSLWDALYELRVQSEPYGDVLGHFLDALRSRGIVLHVESLDGQPLREFIYQTATTAPAQKPQKHAKALSKVSTAPKPPLKAPKRSKRDKLLGAMA